MGPAVPCACCRWDVSMIACRSPTSPVSSSRLLAMPCAFPDPKAACCKRRRKAPMYGWCIRRWMRSSSRARIRSARLSSSPWVSKRRCQAPRSRCYRPSARASVTSHCSAITSPLFRRSRPSSIRRNSRWTVSSGRATSAWSLAPGHSTLSRSVIANPLPSPVSNRWTYCSRYGWC